METLYPKANTISLKPIDLQNFTRIDLRAYFENTWELYEQLFSSIISDETLYLSPDPLRNPLIFYYGHTTAFYINKLHKAGIIVEGVNAHYDQLFAVGVDPDSPENLDILDAFPSVAEVRTYRQTIYNIVLDVIETINMAKPVTPESPIWALLMGLEHDRIHLETSSVLIRQLDAELVQRPEAWEYAPTLGNSPENEWIQMSGGTVNLGKTADSNTYGWDNEYGTLTTEVKPFEATKNLITNSEFWDFVQAGGYENQNLWTAEGWAWKLKTNTHLPKFWVAKNNTYLYRAMFDEKPMPMDFPVEVNAHEAEAYCRWKNDGSRLLSEAEFLWIARQTNPSQTEPYEENHNLNLTYASPTPVGYMSENSPESGFNDIYGNVWDWLSDDFYPLNGYKIHPLYEDFSAPYMDEEHGMMAGGSWVTTGTGITQFYRLWFRRHFYQHAGFRLAKKLYILNNQYFIT